MFKPNLITGCKTIEDAFKLAEKHGVNKYSINRKKDGVRVEVLDGLLGRSLKPSRSKQFNEKFKPLLDICKKLGIFIEGEFYSHGMKFNEIYRFYSNTDVTTKKEKEKLELWSRQFPDKVVDNDIKWRTYPPKVAEARRHLGEKSRLDVEFKGRSIEWLTTFHDSLKIHLFDGYIYGEEHLPFSERISNILCTLSPYFMELRGVLSAPDRLSVLNINELKALYDKALYDKYEGLILTDNEHIYEYRRTPLSASTLLKLKDDNHFYDGIILDVVEGTNVKEGVERGTDNFGNSTTSNCKGDREPNGMAKGFLINYDGIGDFIVSLKGFDNQFKMHLLANKSDYIGRSFLYKAMEPVKDFPRHAFFEEWRDDK